MGHRDGGAVRRTGAPPSLARIAAMAARAGRCGRAGRAFLAAILIALSLPALAEETFVAGDGARLYVHHAGSGKLMLFLHGHPDDWSLYAPQLEEFGRDHLVAAPNLRGYPPSDAPDGVEAYAMPHLLNDIHAVLDHFRQPCVLVGNDWGGYVAWVFASAYPDRVERLIILNAPHPAVFLRTVRTDAGQIRASQYEAANVAARPPYPRWLDYYKADPIKVPPSLEAARTLPEPDLASSFFTGATRQPATTSLHVRVPTLVIWGMDDPISLPVQLDGLDRYVEHLTIERIRAGHLPMREEPRLVNALIRRFLR
jgi:pimeloyl-ACP methyl ester carboxylesterase